MEGSLKAPGCQRSGQNLQLGGLQLAGEGQTGGVELHLRAVEEGVVVGGTGSDLVQLIDHLDDVVQLPLGQGQGQVAGDGGGEGGPHKGLGQAVLVSASEDA